MTGPIHTIISQGCNKDGIQPCCTHAIVQCPTTVISDFQERPENFKPTMVHLIDSTQNTYLFRGNNPLIDIETEPKFAYDQIMQTVSDQLNSMGKSISDDVVFADISFLNYVHEAETIDLEGSWFKENPSKGCLWVYPLMGAFINPVSLPALIRDGTHKIHDADGMTVLMNSLHQLVQSNCGKTFIIYMHCAGGKDRTGEATACYMMQFKGVSYSNAIALQEEIAGRPLGDYCKNVIRWYAFFLRDVKQFTTVGSIEGK